MKIDKEAKHRFEYMAATICDKYCRYPLIWNEEAFGPLAESKKCAECPLTMFKQYVEVDNSCDDVVSRQAVLDIVCGVYEKVGFGWGESNFYKAIQELPSVRPQEPQETETWHGIHAQITAPKGTFERIFNEEDDDNDI